MISPWKWLVATLAGVLVAASLVAVARMGINHAGNPASLWRNVSTSAKGIVASLTRGGGTTAEREGERRSDFVLDPPAGPQRI